MVQWSNYQLAFWVTAFYIGAILSVFLPAPWNIVSFWGGMTVTVGGVFAQPTLAKVIARGFKHTWVQPESDEKSWEWEGRMQWWYKKDPAPTSDWLEWSQEWQSFVKLEKPIRHPFYNNRRRIWGAFVLHGYYSFDNQGREFTDEQKRNLGTWDQLFPNHGGWAVYMSSLVWQPNSDWCVVEEIMPSVKELEEAEEYQAKGMTVLNHVPRIVDGIAYPVFRVKRAIGSRMIENEMLPQIIGAHRPPLEVVSPEAFEVEVEVKA